MDVFEEVFWKTADGSTVKIETMSRRHAANVIAMLERNAELIKTSTVMRLLASAAGPLGPSGDMAGMAFDSMITEIEETDSLLWLRDTPLHKALQDRVSGRTGPPEADLTAYTNLPDPFADEVD